MFLFPQLKQEGKNSYSRPAGRLGTWHWEGSDSVMGKVFFFFFSRLESHGIKQPLTTASHQPCVPLQLIYVFVCVCCWAFLSQEADNQQLHLSALNIYNVCTASERNIWSK